MQCITKCDVKVMIYLNFGRNNGKKQLLLLLGAWGDVVGKLRLGGVGQLEAGGGHLLPPPSTPQMTPLGPCVIKSGLTHFFMLKVN